MESPIFWDTTLRTPLEANRRFGGPCRLHVQSRRLTQARNHYEDGSLQTKQRREEGRFSQLRCSECWKPVVHIVTSVL